MRKLLLIFALLAMFYSYAFAQEPQQTKHSLSLETTVQQDTLGKPQVSTAQVLSGESDDSKQSGVNPLFAFSIFGKSNKDKDSGAKSSRLDCLFEFGVIGKKVPLFAALGLGWSSVNTTVDIPGQSKKYRTERDRFRMPIYFGYLIGDSDKVHVSIRGGAVMNYLVSYKENDKKQNLSGTDRSSWNGSVKFTVGVAMLNFMAEYEFPFVSDGKGVWLFGGTIGF